MPSSVHPRACGEHIVGTVMGGCEVGSSPRLRGTPVPGEPIPKPRRFIPAPAGNTMCRACLANAATVHPRACGEHGDVVYADLHGIGSSPRLRGTPGNGWSQVTLPRFIPAPAGNTQSIACPNGNPPVHPRACGEHVSNKASAAPATGSSPRLRGTPFMAPSLTAHWRFIPAPAGNTARLASLAAGKPVHPRACGEH